MKKLIAAQKLAEHCMAKRNERKVLQERKLIVRDMREAKSNKFTDQVEDLLSRQKDRIKRYLDWEEEYDRDMRGPKRCDKRKARIQAKARRQPLVLIEV